MDFIEETSRLIIENEGVEDVLQAIAKTVSKWYQAEGVDFHMLNETKQTIGKHTVRFPIDPNFPPSRMGSRQKTLSLVNTVSEMGEPLIISNIAQYKGPHILNPAISEYKGYNAFIGLKLNFGTEVMGALFINFSNQT